jgi:hypothetical protein
MPQIINSSNKNDIHIYHRLPNGTPFAAQEDDRGISYHFNPIYIILYILYIIYYILYIIYYVLYIMYYILYITSIYYILYIIYYILYII